MLRGSEDKHALASTKSTGVERHRTRPNPNDRTSAHPNIYSVNFHSQVKSTDQTQQRQEGGEETRENLGISTANWNVASPGVCIKGGEEGSEKEGGEGGSN